MANDIEFFRDLDFVNYENKEEILSILKDLFHHFSAREALIKAKIIQGYSVENSIEMYLDLKDLAENGIVIYDQHIIEKAVSMLADKYFEVKQGEKDESLAKYAKMKLMNDLGA